MDDSDQDQLTSKDIEAIPTKEGVNLLQSQRDAYVKNLMGKILIVIAPIALILIYIIITHFDVSSRWLEMGIFIVTLFIAGIFAEWMAKQKFGPEVKVRNPAFEKLSFAERVKQKQLEARSAPEFKRKSYMSRKMRFYLLILCPIGLGVSFLLVVFTSLPPDIAVSAAIIVPIAVSWLLAEIKTQKFFKE